MWASDPGYSNYPAYRGCRVTVDGDEVSRVFTADDERGEVVCAALNEEGQTYLDGDEIATETLRGKVCIHKP